MCGGDEVYAPGIGNAAATIVTAEDEPKLATATLDRPRYYDLDELVVTSARD